MDDLTTISHNDPARPAFGYDGTDRFDRAHRAFQATERADRKRAHAAERIAESVVRDVKPYDYEVQAYAKARAGALYADAVFTVEAERVRAA